MTIIHQTKYRIAKYFKKTERTRPTGITSINLPGYAGTIANELRDFVTKYKPSLRTPQGGGFNFGIPMTFFANGGFVDDLEIGMDDDYGMTQTDFDAMAQSDNVNQLCR